MTQVMHGIVHGKTIEFEHAIGVPEGQQVEVMIRPLTAVRLNEGQGERLSADEETVQWTDEQNAQRCFLIDKEVRQTITPAEARELEDLQDQLRRYRRHVAPLPLAQTRRMLEELEGKVQASS
jgi:hypothetical protein